MEDFLQSVRIVLCDPKEARNVGGCIRAAANAGISKVSVIKEGGAYAYDLIDTYSAGAIEKISVEYFTSLQDAISDAHLVIGTSGLAPSKRGPSQWPARGLRERMIRSVGGKKKVFAVLFGNERHGLSAAQLSACAAYVTIPTSTLKPSMNLAHAVACVCYELARPRAGGKRAKTPKDGNIFDGGATGVIF